MKVPGWLKRFTHSEGHGDASSVWHKIRDSDPDILVLEDNREKFREHFVRVDPSDKRVYISRFDSPRSVTSEYEYRIEGTKVFARLIEESEDDPELELRNQYWVKDNVVVESEIAESEFHRDWLALYREEVEWHELQPILTYFILSRQPTVLSDIESRRFFRQELERLRRGIATVTTKAADIGAHLYETTDGHYKLRFSEDKKSDNCALAEDNEKIRKFYEHSLDACGISFQEFHGGKRLIGFLEGLLAG